MKFSNSIENVDLSHGFQVTRKIMERSRPLKQKKIPVVKTVVNEQDQWLRWFESE